MATADAVIADMVEGVLAANRLRGGGAEAMRRQLVAALSATGDAGRDLVADTEAA